MDRNKFEQEKASQNDTKRVGGLPTETSPEPIPEKQTDLPPADEEVQGETKAP